MRRVFSLAERAMSMDDTAWARHANRWSVWTRFTCLPLLALAVWSRDWIGWWSVPPIALAAFWTWYNPRAFPPNRVHGHWGAKGTYGERLLLATRTVPVPAHHERAANALGALSAPGVVLLIYGLADLHLWATITGTVAAVLPKLWFCDRMVWLYEDMRREGRVDHLNLPNPP